MAAFRNLYGFGVRMPACVAYRARELVERNIPPEIAVEYVIARARLQGAQDLPPKR